MTAFSSNSNLKKQQKHHDLLSTFAIVLLVVAITHHTFFCFLNTHLIHTSSRYLLLTELFFLGVTALFFIQKLKISYLIIVIFIFANTFILALFQQGFDPKYIRNFMIPVLLVWLGTQYNHKISVDNLLKWIGSAFLIFGLFELFLPQIFQKIFNVIQFQLSIGRGTDKDLEYLNSTFALNGTRYGGRNLLPFLGDHRVASLFLETVNTSNFSTVLAAWGLSKSDLKKGFVFFFIGFIVAVLADSRFGVTTIILMATLRLLLPKTTIKPIMYIMPIPILLLCFYLGWDYSVFRDDFVTRLGSTGYYIMNFEPLEFFGLSSNHYHLFLDQGYAKLLHYNGILLAIILWVTFCRLPVNDAAIYFHFFVALIITTNLAVSGDSIFSFKWVVTMWFLVGTQLKPKDSYQKSIL